MDFTPATRPCPCISEPDAHYLRLIEELLLEAGRLMENASLDFALSLADITAVSSRIDRLDLIAGDLHALAQAARALLRNTTYD